MNGLNLPIKSGDATVDLSYTATEHDKPQL